MRESILNEKNEPCLLMRKLILYSLFFSCYVLFSIAYISQQDLSWNIEITMCLQSILQVNDYNEYKTNMVFISLTLLKNKTKPITHVHLLLSNLLKLTKHKQAESVFFSAMCFVGKLHIRVTKKNSITLLFILIHNFIRNLKAITNLNF